jgi:methylated-DNA-protein-cysteine methyltransferase related protein
MADFRGAVRAVIASLPRGETFSYGWVADEAGYPGRARAVGTLLATDGDDLPWWRVVRADGHFVEHLAGEQAERLRAEGVAVRVDRVLEGPHHAPRTPARPRARRLG